MELICGEGGSFFSVGCYIILRNNYIIHPIVQSQISVPSVESIKSELLDTKEVLSILGVCFNTLKQLVKKGLIKRVKINERRVRYPKSSILDFIRTTSN